MGTQAAEQETDNEKSGGENNVIKKSGSEYMGESNVTEKSGCERNVTEKSGNGGKRESGCDEEVTEKSGKRKEIQSELIVRETKTESSEQKIRDRRKLVPKRRMEKSDNIE